MKKLLFVISFIFLTQTTYAQLEVKYGVKAGLNYNSNGDLTITGTIAGLNEKVSNKSDLGYHIGFYTQLNFTKIYLRPEIVFSKTRSSFDNTLSPSSTFELSTLELPVLAGYKIIKPIHIYIGPSFQYVFDSKFSSNFDLDIKNKLTLGLNIGSSLQLNKFGVDVRYTSGLSKNLATYLDAVPADGAGYSLDAKSNQLTLSFSYQIN